MGYKKDFLKAMTLGGGGVGVDLGGVKGRSRE